MNDGIFQSELAAVIQPRVLVKPESWLSKIEFINHLVLFNNVLITVLSEKEGGKTSFASLLQNDLDQQIKLLSMTVKAPCNREDIISDIATQFHLKHDADTDLSSLVAQINERRSHVLLLIDDAQHLPETFIKEVMLAIKGQEDFSFFHLCLVSDYSVVASLNGMTSSFFDNLVHTIELGALNESEARTYVLQRAMAARLINKPLTENQLKQLYQLTKGSVAKINSSLESFIFNCTNKKQSNFMDVVKKISIPVGAAVISGASCLFIAKAYYENAATTVSVPVQTQNATMLAVNQPEQPESYIASWQDSATRHLVAHTLAERQNLDVITKGLSGNTVAIADKAIAKAKLAVSATSRRHAQPSHRRHVASTQQEPKLYTIQLVASPEKIDMQRFKNGSKLLSESAKLGHYKEKKETWYVLTFGEYSTVSEAQKSIDQLPPALTRLNPWVRTISTLG
ncbi:MAG: AAA family ATPase [Legionella sp.]|nr:AAA family ATPase [Legionella sp.]